MYVKENTDVKTNADLQNLVVSVILRQVDEFTLDDIIHGANLRLVGSPYHASEELTHRCADTIDTLFVFNKLQVVGKDKYALSMPWPAVSGR